MKPTAAPPFDVLATPIAPGITLVEASAGTGKTYSLTALVLRLLLEEHASSIGKILVMTFTKAATAELVDRIRMSLRDAVDVFRDPASRPDGLLRQLAKRHGENGLRILERALRDLDDLEVGTIHGFCRRILAQNAFETGSPFDVEYSEDDGVLVQRAAEDFWRRRMYPAGDLIAAIAENGGWKPTRFLDVYTRCRNTPGVEILPKPLALDAAIRALDEPIARVRQSWDREDMSDLLETADFTSNKEMTPPERLARLEGADAFCALGDSSKVADVLALHPVTLGNRLKKKHRERLEEMPFARATAELDSAITAFEHALRAAFVSDIDVLLEREKMRAGRAHYDDLLHRLHAALQDPERAPALRRAAAAQFEAVLVDEFQDTDAIQYRIFRDLFAGGRLFLVGDPKQTIYGFRGADVFAYIRAKRDAEHAYTLTTNYRSETPLVSAVNALFSRLDDPFVFPEIPFEPADPRGSADAEPLVGDGRCALEWMWLLPQSSKEAGTERAIAAVTREIVRLLTPATGARIGGRPVVPRDIAVLVRSNVSGTRMQAALADAGVPAVVTQADNVFRTEEASELRALLAAVIAPRDAGALRAALATRAFGYDAAGIAALAADETAWQDLVDRFTTLLQAWHRRSFMAMAEELLTFAGTRARLLETSSGARRLTNLLHLVELLEKASLEHHLAPDGVLAWYSRVLADPARLGEDATEIRLETDADAVQIATIHKSKGLEYGIVFCPFLWDGRAANEQAPLLAHLPDDRVVYHFPPSPPEVLSAHECERESEEARHVYVALTRAKHRCYIAWGRFGRSASEHSTLARLLHADAGSSPEDWRQQLESFCSSHGEIMAVRDEIENAPAPRWEQPAAPETTLRARAFPEDAKSGLVPWRVASFSSLRAPSSPTHVPPTVELPDHMDAPAGPAAEAAAPRGIFAFAKGARAGTCLHEIFEKCDFTRVREPETADLVETTLRSHGLDAAAAHHARIAPVEVALRMLTDVVESTLPGAGFPLSGVSRAERLVEWQFHLPLAAVSQSRLAAAFTAHANGMIRDRYAGELRALGDRTVEGFLMGFVDLVFVHDGRWYVVDWKSNHLGNTESDYGDAAIARTMREHHYILQYHLYCLALHRYLGQRLSGYDYEEHFGGVYYAFLRGIRADGGGGWYHDRPPRALIEALDSLMRGELPA